MKRTIVFLALMGVALFSDARADYKDDIGFTALQLQLGGSLPTGTGVSVSQVEADLDFGPAIAYMPDVTDVAFSLDSITNATTSPAYASPNVSSHATMVGQLIYGSNAIASGVSSVTVYNANDWIVNQLRFGSGMAPLAQTRDVVNHSWVGTTGNAAADTEILQRLDSTVQQNDYVVSVGVNNGVGQERNLLASAYNVIGVGVSSGNHSSGTTIVDGPGRQVVDIVVPTANTSQATAVVSSASALLIQTARDSSWTTTQKDEAQKNQTIRAVLLAGATKDDLPSWSHSSDHPLDSVYGAGELNIQNSYNIMAAGEQSASPTATVASTGWDHGNITSTTTEQYHFTLQDPSSLAVALTWNASLTGGWTSLTTNLANLDLRLFTSSGTLIDESISTVDNSEYLWQQYLAAGDYYFVLSSASPTSTDYSLAWKAETVPEPGSFVLFGLGLGFLGYIACRRKSRRTP